MRKDCSNMDGVIENFDAVLASTPIGNRFDQDNFYPMDGMVENYDAVLADTPIGNRFDQDNFYPASGIGARIGKRLRNTKIGKKVRKFKAKKQQANAQNEKVQADARKQLAKGAQDDKALLDALKPSSVVELEKEGLSMGAKIGIGVGIAAVLGIGAYFILKNKSK
jgi:hypothetical protein